MHCVDQEGLSDDHRQAADERMMQMMVLGIKLRGKYSRKISWLSYSCSICVHVLWLSRKMLITTKRVPISQIIDVARVVLIESW